MSKTVFTSKEAKNNFGELADEARSAPVFITKNGRKSLVIMSVKEYEEAEKAIDAIWGKMADEAGKEGFLTAEETAKRLKSYLK